MTTAPTKNASGELRRIDEVEHGFDPEGSDELSMQLDLLLADAGRPRGPGPRLRANRRMTRFTAALEPRTTHRKDSRS